MSSVLALVLFFGAQLGQTATVILLLIRFYGASLVAQMVKSLPTMWEVQVQSLGWDDPLEKGMATHSSILSWRIPWTEEPGRLQFIRSPRVGHDLVT